eukprot:1633626-Pyramimonas_sp.AAC.2
MLPQLRPAASAGAPPGQAASTGAPPGQAASTGAPPGQAGAVAANSAAAATPAAEELAARWRGGGAERALAHVSALARGGRFAPLLRAAGPYLTCGSPTQVRGDSVYSAGDSCEYQGWPIHLVEIKDAYYTTYCTTCYTTYYTIIRRI